MPVSRHGKSKKEWRKKKHNRRQKFLKEKSDELWRKEKEKEMLIKKWNEKRMRAFKDEAERNKKQVLDSQEGEFIEPTTKSKNNAKLHQLIPLEFKGKFEKSDAVEYGGFRVEKEYSNPKLWDKSKHKNVIHHYILSDETTIGINKTTKKTEFLVYPKKDKEIENEV